MKPLVGSPKGGQQVLGESNTNEPRRDVSSGVAGHTSDGRLVDWLVVVGERTANALLYTSGYFAVIAMVYATIPMGLLSLPPNPAPLVIGLVTFAVYANDSLVDVDADAITNPEQAAFIRRNKNTLYVLAAAAYGLAVSLSILGGPEALSLTIIPGVFWILYATDWIPDIGLTIRRLKEVFVVNSLVVALGWAVSITFLPVAFTGATLSSTVGFVFLYAFLRSFTNTEIPNVRDIESDRAAGVSTIPVMFGVRRTRHLLYGIDAFTIGLVGYGVLAGHLPAVLSGALLVGLVYSLGVTFLVGRADDRDLLAIASECEYLLVGIALFWILYGL